MGIVITYLSIKMGEILKILVCCVKLLLEIIDADEQGNAYAVPLPSSLWQEVVSSGEEAKGGQNKEIRGKS